MGMLLGVLSRCSGVPRGSQEAQWVNLVTKKFVYSSDIVVGFENFEIGQKTKKLAPKAPDWGYPVDAQECAEVVKSAQWVNLVKIFLYIHWSAPDIVVGFEIFEIAPKTKKLAPTEPD